MDFLRGFDPHVPCKADRPWLWPVLVNGIPYGIPCTTQQAGAGFAGYLRCGAVPGHGLYPRYMTPVPQAALLPTKSMPPEPREEPRYYEENRKYIEAEARILHRLSGLGQMDRFFQEHSCDFKKLDSVYFQWQPGQRTGYFLYPKKEASAMPVSKNGKAYFTKEQYEAARYNANALEYARSRGYDLVRQGAYYTMREHDSMVFTPQGTWFWNSRGVHGSALEFQMYYEDKTLTEAVLTLAGERELETGRPREQQPAARPPVRDAPAPKAFRIPDRARDFRQLFRYLCVDRGLDKSVVQEMIQQNRLYQSAFAREDGKVICNATFVYRDARNNAVGAFQRGMADYPGQPPYKRDVPGSDKRWGWLLASPFAPAGEVRVFEGAIDAASDASLAAMARGGAWRAAPIDRLSLEGLSILPLQTYLRERPDVRQIRLMLDADEPGRRAAGEFARQLTDQGYQVDNVTPPFGKDWNEVLVSTRAMEAEARPVPAPEPVPEP